MTDIRQDQAPTEDTVAGNVNGDLLNTPVKIGRFEIKAISLNTAILLEQINSPFMRRSVDPLTGERIAVVPTMQEMAETLYVLIYQEDPRLGMLLEDLPAFERTVRQFASGISFAELKTISEGIGAAIKRANRAVEDSGMEPSEKKGVTGPSPS